MESRTDTETPATEPPGSHWLLYLFFRPRQFFRHFVVTPVPVLTVLAAVGVGVADVSGRVDSDLDDVTGSTWASYWGITVAVGLLCALGIVVLAGWWYRFRLERCGAINPDRRLTLRVYLFANLVWALPVLTHKVWETASYPTPLEAVLATWDVSVISWNVFLLWSVWTSYSGATTAFALNVTRARIWFLVLPASLYVLLLTQAHYLEEADSTPGPFAETPDLEHPVRVERDRFSFEYPGNWIVDSTAPGFDPDRHFTIVPPIADCSTSIHLSKSFRSLEEALSTYQDELSAQFELGSWKPWGPWGGLSGLGRTALGEYETTRYKIRLFATRYVETIFVVREICALDDLPTVGPGLASIRESFRWK